MRILIDARNVYKGKNGPSTYGRNLLRHLLQIPSNISFVIIKNNDWADQLSQSDRAKEVILSLKPYDLREQFELAKIALREKADVFHSLLPFTSFLLPIKYIVTIQDLMALKLPNFFRRHGWKSRFIRNYFNFMMSQSVKRSSAVLTTSEFSKREIVDYFNNNSDSVFACSAGIDDLFSLKKQVDNEAVRLRYGLPSRYFFHLGNMSEYKNVLRIIEAFKKFCEGDVGDVGLVLAGRPDQYYLREIYEKINQLKLVNRVLVLKDVMKEDIPSLYCLAEAFVFPSISEGFGLPILEAMSCGTPVITSDAASMSEVAGNAALLVNPWSVDDIAKKMYNVFSDRELNKQLRSAGLARVAQFSWRATANKVLEMYKKVFEQ